MIPLIVLGALIGGFATAEAVSSSNSSSATPSSGRSRASGDSQAAVSPQSYVITPIDSGARRLSAVEAVGKLIV